MDEKNFRLFIAGCILILFGIMGWAAYHEFCRPKYKDGLIIEGPNGRLIIESEGRERTRNK